MTAAAAVAGGVPTFHPTPEAMNLQSWRFDRPRNCQTLDARAAFMGWADHCGQLTLDDVDALLHSHGFTVADWLNDCDARGWHDRTRSAEALLTWLGY